MQKIQDALAENPYLANCADTIFTVMLRHALIDNPELDHLKKYKFVHGLLQYPKWHGNSDIFQFIGKKDLGAIRKGKSYFVFDSSTEGFSPTKEFPFFEMLYYNCEKYNIHPSRIIYVSSNLLDEENIKAYAKQHNKKSFHVFSFLSFEQVLTLDDRHGLGIIDRKYEEAYEYNKRQFRQYYFSSLSRVNRAWRTFGTFLLWNSPVRDKGLISHNKYSFNDGFHLLNGANMPGVTDEQIAKFLKSLPLVVDQNDFNKNWALDTPYRHIHDQTIFQIVNETLVHDYGNTSLFYSEKTFRPIAYFQPMLIWGQPGCNKYLKNVGYKTYEDWFDLSFDDEKNHKVRYTKLLDTVIDTCKKLDSMTNDQKVEWRFQNEDVLKHNFEVMTKSTFSKEKLNKFLKDLV